MQRAITTATTRKCWGRSFIWDDRCRSPQAALPRVEREEIPITKHQIPNKNPYPKLEMFKQRVSFEISDLEFVICLELGNCDLEFPCVLHKDTALHAGKSLAPTPFRGRDPDFTSGPFQPHIAAGTFRLHGIPILSESGVSVRISRIAPCGRYPLPAPRRTVVGVACSDFPHPALSKNSSVPT